MLNREYFNNLKKNKGDFTRIIEAIRNSNRLDKLPKHILNAISSKESLLAFLREQDVFAKQISIEMLVTQIINLNLVEAATLLLSNSRYLEKLEANNQEFKRLISHFKNNLQWLQALKNKFSTETLRKHLSGHVDCDEIVGAVAKLKGKTTAGADSDNTIIQTLFDNSNPYHQDNLAYYIKNPEKCSNCLKQRQVTDMFVIASASQIVCLCLALAKNRIDLLKQHFVQVARHDNTNKIQQALTQNSNAITTEFLCYKPRVLTRELFCTAPNTVDIGTFKHYLMSTHHPRYLLKAHSDLTLSDPMVGQVKAVDAVDGINNLLNNNAVQLSTTIHFLVKFKYRLFKRALNNQGTRTAVMNTLNANPNRNEWVIMHLRENPELVKILCAGDGNSKNFLDFLKMTDDPAKFVRKLAGQVNSKDRAKIIFQSVLWVARYTEQHPEYQNKFEKLLKEKFWCNGGYRSVREIAVHFISNELYQHKPFSVGTKTTRDPEKAQWLTQVNPPEDDLRFILQNENTRNLFRFTKQQIQQLAVTHLHTQTSHKVIAQHHFNTMDIGSLAAVEANLITQKSIYYILQNLKLSEGSQLHQPEHLQKQRQLALNEAIYGVHPDEQSTSTKQLNQLVPANFFDTPLQLLKDMDPQDVQVFIEFFKAKLAKLDFNGIVEIQKRFHGQLGDHNFDAIIADHHKKFVGERIRNAAKLDFRYAAEVFYEYAKDPKLSQYLDPYFLGMINDKNNERAETEIRRKVFYGAILKGDWVYISENKSQFIQDLKIEGNYKEHFSVFDTVLPVDITGHVRDWSLTELFDLRNYESILSVLISRLIENKPLDKKDQEVFLNLLKMPEFRSMVKLGQQLPLLTLIEAARKDPVLQVKILTETIQRFRNEPLGEACPAFLTWYKADQQVRQYLLVALPDIVFNNQDNQKFTRDLLSGLSDRKRDLILRDKRCDHQFKNTYPEVANYKTKVSQSNIPTQIASSQPKGMNISTTVHPSQNVDPKPVLVTETATSETSTKPKKDSSILKKLKKKKKEKEAKQDAVVTTTADKLEDKNAKQQTVQTQVSPVVKQEANNSAENNVDPTEFTNVEEIYQFIYENRNNQKRCINTLTEINKINQNLIAVAFRPLGTIDYTLGLLLENLESKLSFSITETKVTTQPKSPPPARKHKEKVHKPDEQEKNYDKAKKVRAKKTKKAELIQFSLDQKSQVTKNTKEIAKILDELQKSFLKHSKDEFNHLLERDNKSVWLAYEAVKLQYKFLENLEDNRYIAIYGDKSTSSKSQNLTEIAKKYELNNKHKQEQALRQISGVADQYAKDGFRILAAHYYQDIIATCSEDELDINISYDATVALIKLLMEDPNLFPNSEQMVGELFKSFFDNKIYTADFIKSKIKDFPLGWLVSHAIVECISDNLDEEDPNAEMAEYISHLKPAVRNPDNALANENLDELKKKLELKEFVMQFNDNQGNAPALTQLLTRIFKRDPKLLFNENLAFDFTDVITTVDSDINILLFYLRNRGLSERWLSDKNTMQQLYDLAKKNQLIRFTLETCYTHWSEAIAKDAFAHVVMVSGTDQNQNNGLGTAIDTINYSSMPTPPPPPPGFPPPPPPPDFNIPTQTNTDNQQGLAGILSGAVKLKKTEGSIDDKLAADKEKNANEPSDSKSGSDAQNAVFKSIQDINEVKLKAAWQALFFADKDAISSLGHALLKCLNVQQEADISPAVKRGLSDVYNSIFKVKDEVSGDEVLKNLLANANLKTLPKEIRRQFKDIAAPIAELAKAKKLEPVKKPPTAPRANPIVVKNSGIKADYQIKESLKEKDGINLTAFLGHVDQVVKITDPLVKMYEQLIRIKEKKDPTTMEEFKKELCKLLEAYMTDASKQLVKDAHEKGEGAASLEQTITTRAGLVITKMEVLYSLYAISHEKASRSSFLDAIASRKPKSQESSKSPATEIISPIYNLCMDQEKVFDKTEIRKIMVKQNDVALQNIEREIAQAIEKLNKGNRINREILLGKIQGIVNGNRKHVAEIFEAAIWKRLQEYAKHIKKENCLIDQLEQSIIATVPTMDSLYKDNIFDKKSIADNISATSVPNVEAVLVDIIYFIRSNKPVFRAEFFKILESVIDNSHFDTVIWNAVKAYAEKLGKSHLVQDRDPLKEPRKNGPKLFDKSKPTVVTSTMETVKTQNNMRPNSNSTAQV